MKARPLMYEFDDSAAAIGVFLLTMVLVIMFYIATPAKSQEAPGAPPCGPADKLQEQLEKQYGETIVGGGFVNNDIIIITTNPKSHSFTIMMRRPDGIACLLIGGKGFAMADPAGMKGSGL